MSASQPSRFAPSPSQSRPKPEFVFEPLLDSDEAAELLRIHPKTLQRMARNRQIHGILQSRNRLGVCLSDNERQATALARNSLATIRATGSEGGEDPEAGWVPHLPPHVHNSADSEQRGSEGGTGAPTSCKQSHYARSLRSGGDAEQAAGTKQTGSDGAQQGRGTGLTGS
jgi:hypothetical protein